MSMLTLLAKDLRSTKFRPEQDLKPDLGDANAVLYQLNYKANWELVTTWGYDEPTDSGYLHFSQ